ncbi:hypothetical protein GR217_35230 [Rhizobium leguminosarum]|uniref:Uncharacterized protein n=1 Tax=Rhizobium ruizarguesonis TaxID=2081791 RepID=A0AAE4YY98_9HYPH|nr:hypothetical protein [Rhizobium ruizarguesonis]NEI52864.1 hypothetical protein [Rhizobium ruizarguesonis]
MNEMSDYGVVQLSPDEAFAISGGFSWWSFAAYFVSSGLGYIAGKWADNKWHLSSLFQ